MYTALNKSFLSFIFFGTLVLTALPQPSLEGYVHFNITGYPGYYETNGRHYLRPRYPGGYDYYPYYYPDYRRNYYNPNVYYYSSHPYGYSNGYCAFPGAVGVNF